MAETTAETIDSTDGFENDVDEGAEPSSYTCLLYTSPSPRDS